MTGSFSFVRDDQQNVLDLTEAFNNSEECRTLFLDNSWYYEADANEVFLDTEKLPEPLRQSILSAYKAAVVPKGGFKKKKNTARREATATEKQRYHRSFVEAKQTEIGSWQENDVAELVDMRKSSKTLSQVAGFSPLKGAKKETSKK